MKRRRNELAQVLATRSAERLLESGMALCW